jgi:putative transposase
MSRDFYPQGGPKHNRQSIRLKGYDYTRPGSYFITICTQNREHVFGEIINGRMYLNPFGNVADQCWQDIPVHYPHVVVDEYVVMPNHVHGIISIVAGDDGIRRYGNRVVDETVPGGRNHDMDTTVGANNYSPLPPQPRGTSNTIGSIVRGFKIGVTKWAHQNTDIHTVWQRNYYDHIIRDEWALHRIRQYIKNNPMKWKSDDLF